MKLWKKLSTTILILAAVSLAAQIERSPEGQIKVEKLQFGFLHWGKDWSSFNSSIDTPSLVGFTAEGGEKTASGIRRNGSFRTNEGTFALTETINVISPDNMEILYELSSDQGVPTELLTYSTLIPLADYQNQPVIFNNQVIPPEKNGICFPGKADGCLTIPLNGGMLKIYGNFDLVIKVSSKTVQVRIMIRGYGNLKKASLKLKLEYIPAATAILNLNSAVNMGFADQTADDRRGGWTDQGPDNDLSAMTPGATQFRGIPFFIIDPGQNRGNSCIALRGEQRPYFAETAKVSAAGIAGKYLYVLNGIAWAGAPGTVCGEIIVRYADGSSVSHELKCGVDTGNFWTPRPLQNGFVGWRNSNASADIGLYVTTVALDRDKKLKEIEFCSRNQVWMIVGASVSDKLPDASTDAAPITMAANHEWLPLDYQWQTVKDSVLDLSPLLDAPAGKYGFLKIGNHGTFEFTDRPGQPVRFWGANVCSHSMFQSNADTVRMLDDLAAMGYNSIRLHHFDGLTIDREGKLRPSTLDKLDFLLAEAKKRGIYLSLDLLTIRMPANIGQYGQLSLSEYKLLCYFDADAYAELLNFAKILLCHPNPYTGLAWKDDPAVALINLINEGTLSLAKQRITEKIRPAVNREFATWQKDKPVVANDQDALFRDFLIDAGRQFYRQMQNDLRSLGVKTPMSDQNFVFDLPTQEVRTAYDYVDTHFYWCHPTYIGQKLWTYPTQTGVSSAINAWSGGFRDVSNSRIYGQPMTVSEWNYCYPNPFQVEGPFLTAAGAALQGYDGLWQFTYSDAASISTPETMGSFSYAWNPLMKLAARAGAFLYLRRDVAESPVAFAYLQPDTLTAKITNLPRLSLIAKTGMLSTTTANRHNITVLPVDANEERLLKNLIAQKLIPANAYDFEREITRSVTGEIMLNRLAGTFQVKTANAEVLVLPPGKSGDGEILKVDNRQNFAAVSLFALNGQTLRQSKRLLLLHLTENKNRGAIFIGPEMSIQENAGVPEVLIKRGVAEIILKDLNIQQIYACGVNGKRLFEVPLIRQNQTVKFTADTSSDRGPVAVYEIIVP